MFAILLRLILVTIALNLGNPNFAVNIDNGTEIKILQPSLPVTGILTTRSARLTQMLLPESHGISIMIIIGRNRPGLISKTGSAPSL